MKRLKTLSMLGALAAIFSLAAPEARAQVELQYGIEDMKVFVTTGTPVDVLSLVASSTTLHVAATTAQRRYRFVVIENLHPTASLWVSRRSNVGTQSDANSLQGREVPPGKWVYYTLKAGDPFYAISDSSLATGTSSYVTVGR